jgi:hypothetical protein
MIFALVASVAVAEISVGAWGRGFFVPVQNDGLDENEGGDKFDGATTDTAVSWGSKPRIGFTLSGNSENVGVQVDFNVDDGSFGLGDQQMIWVKPVDMLTLSLGNIYDDTLRGNAAFGSFNWLRAYGNGDGEDITFTRFGANRADNENFMIAVKPMDALYAGLYLSALDKKPAENMIANMQLGAGYTIDGIGQIKFQILRKADNFKDDGVADEVQTTVEAAFNYTGMENLFVELGFAMATNNDVRTDITSFLNVDADENGDGKIDDDEKIKVEEYKKIALYAKYNMDAMTIHFSSINRLFKAVDTEVLYKLIAGLDYDLGEGVGVEADVSYLGTTADDIDGVVTFFAGAKKGFSNGVIGAGVQVKNDGSDTYFGIPIRMEYWF